ncbi:hypothetical protein LHYA1_G004293 [Lachnellula hyalina]|uniref:NAD-dependent epimerase/dehydratase domain-containing protein n=1 Tax=Lachnellula hyalina TaxID=1316788 RepID=A0A8H8R1R0_9HELO|nr:uncharacterized protein LHYA1_G004293 [Lachnellula hyalina]TVY26076.1 hypothetical protein LHYA1_G004293 [Lachnellula hyalina]
MAPRIFLTGASGYVGGQFIPNMRAKHPSYQIISLVRTKETGEKLTSKYPSVQIVIGDLDSSSLLVEQSKLADVVIQAADCDHLNAITCIMRGLSAGARNAPLIQLSGAASVLDICNGVGQRSPRVWDDGVDLDEILSFDATHVHHASDKLVFSEGKKHDVRTAIVAPPMIYGRGHGIKEWSMGLPWLVGMFKNRGKGFVVGEGKTIVSSIHVRDIADVLVYFAEQALGAEDGGRVEWGEKGGRVYFFGHVDVIAREMKGKGMIETAELDSLTSEEADQLHPWATFMYGSNMRICASRLRGLGWTPKQPGVIETVFEMLE